MRHSSVSEKPQSLAIASPTLIDCHQTTSLSFPALLTHILLKMILSLNLLSNLHNTLIIHLSEMIGSQISK